MKSSRKTHLGRVPNVAWSCRMGKRAKASNLVKNILRAVRQGNCKRADIILNDYEYANTTNCMSYAANARIQRKVQECFARAR